MSERANGWLLILGGLAIGLVLWLSPSQGRSAGKLEMKVASIGCADSDRAVHCTAVRHPKHGRPVLVAWLMKLSGCMDDFEAKVSA